MTETEKNSYGAETYREGGCTDGRLLYTVNVENEYGQISDMNAEGEPITTTDELIDFIHELYMQKAYDEQEEAALTEQAHDLEDK